MSKYVRLKPFSKPKGFLCRRFVYRGTLFKEGQWRLVPDMIAEELETKIQPRSEDHPLPLFDIATKAEAEKLEQREKPELGERVQDAVVLDAEAFRAMPGDADAEPKKAEVVLPPQARRKRR